jgi:hypothetical protein
MLCREIDAVCFEMHTKHINTLCGENGELLSVKPGGTYSNHWALKGYFTHRPAINWCNSSEAKEVMLLHSLYTDAITLRSVWTHFLDHWAERASDIHVGLLFRWQVYVLRI